MAIAGRRGCGTPIPPRLDPRPPFGSDYSESTTGPRLFPVTKRNGPRRQLRLLALNLNTSARHAVSSFVSDSEAGDEWIGHFRHRRVSPLPRAVRYRRDLRTTAVAALSVGADVTSMGKAR